jgi:UDP-glucose:(heptosyl)LPS alpha-1,3-glucosyltransferase
MVARDLQRHHNIDPENIAVVHNGVDATRFAPAQGGRAGHIVRRELNISSNDLVFLFVALHPGNKGLQTLVQVAARLVREGHGIHVVVVGGAPSSDELALVKQLGVHKRVHWIGRVDDPTSYYHASDICVHLTPYDACSLVVLEALASGLPVVTTQDNGAGELIEDGVCGYVTRAADDIDDAYRHTRALLQSDVRQEMSVNARAAAEKLTLEHNFQRIVELYHSVLERKHHGRPPACERRHAHQPQTSDTDETHRHAA